MNKKGKHFNENSVCKDKEDSTYARHRLVRHL